MIIAQPLQTELRRDRRSHVEPCSDEIVRQLSSAQRELAAFVAAVAKLFGPMTADRAAECWVALAETTDLPLVDGCINWRRITTKAAGRMAIERYTSVA